MCRRYSISNHGASSWLGASALTKEKHLTNKVTLNQNRIIDTINLSQKGIFRDKNRVNPYFNRLIVLLGNSQQLYSVTELSSIPEVATAELRNPLTVNILRPNLTSKGL